MTLKFVHALTHDIKIRACVDLRCHDHKDRDEAKNYEWPTFRRNIFSNFEKF